MINVGINLQGTTVLKKDNNYENTNWTYDFGS